MAKAFSYIRFSTPEQSQGDSLRRQTAKAEAWAKERGMVLDDTLRDLGVSAYHGLNRTTGALRTFLDMVQDGKIERGSYLIVESLDRISRETVMDAATRLFELIRAGIIVVTLSDGQEYSEKRLQSDWTPLMFSLIVMARAHEESKIKSERVGEAWRQKKEVARAEKKPLTPRCPEWLEVRDDKFVERPDRVALVRRVFTETIEGFGRREIVRRFNSEGVPTFRGGAGWHTSSIAKIIQSRSVIGEYQPHIGTHRNRNRRPDGDPIRDFYPAIVEADLFWRAQAATQGRRHAAAGRKGISGAHLFQGIATCSQCLGPMHIINKGKPPKGGVYLACSSHMRNMGCSNSRRWRVDKLELALIQSLATLHFNNVLEDLDPGTPQIDTKINVLTTQIADLQRRQTSLVALVELDDDTAKARSVELAKAIRGLKAELQAAKEEQKLFISSPNIVERTAAAVILSRQFETLENEDQKKRDLRIKLQQAIRGIVLNVECDEKFGATATFVKRTVPYRLLARTKAEEWIYMMNVSQSLEDGHQSKILLDWRDLPKSLRREWELSAWR